MIACFERKRFLRCSGWRSRREAWRRAKNEGLHPARTCRTVSAVRPAPTDPGGRLRQPGGAARMPPRRAKETGLPAVDNPVLFDYSEQLAILLFGQLMKWLRSPVRRGDSISLADLKDVLWAVKEAWELHRDIARACGPQQLTEVPARGPRRAHRKVRSADRCAGALRGRQAAPAGAPGLATRGCGSREPVPAEGPSVIIDERRRGRPLGSFGKHRRPVDETLAKHGFNTGGQRCTARLKILAPFQTNSAHVRPVAKQPASAVAHSHAGRTESVLLHALPTHRRGNQGPRPSHQPCARSAQAVDRGCNGRPSAQKPAARSIHRQGGRQSG